jgi:hypothetical protein
MVSSAMYVCLLMLLLVCSDRSQNVFADESLLLMHSRAK